jgi:hypothetical protein
MLRGSKIIDYLFEEFLSHTQIAQKKKGGGVGEYSPYTASWEK